MPLCGKVAARRTNVCVLIPTPSWPAEGADGQVSEEINRRSATVEQCVLALNACIHEHNEKRIKI